MTYDMILDLKPPEHLHCHPGCSTTHPGPNQKNLSLCFFSFPKFNSVLERLETDACEETLLSLFNDQATSDNMVQYLRLLTSAHLQSHADLFQHFVEAPNLKVYCTQVSSTTVTSPTVST